MNYRVLVLSLIGVALVEAVSASTTSNLTCKVQSTKTLSTGDVEKQAGLALIEIQESQPRVTIRVSSDIKSVYAFASSAPSPAPSSWDQVNTNFSTDNRWDVYSSINKKGENGRDLLSPLGSLLIEYPAFSSSTSSRRATGSRFKRTYPGRARSHPVKRSFDCGSHWK